MKLGVRKKAGFINKIVHYWNFLELSVIRLILHSLTKKTTINFRNVKYKSDKSAINIKS